MRKNRQSNKDTISEILIELIKNPKIDQVNLAKKLGYTRGRIHQIVKELKDKGVLEYRVEKYFVLKRLDKV